MINSNVVGTKHIIFVDYSGKYEGKVGKGEEYVVELEKPIEDFIGVPDIEVHTKMNYDIIYDGKWYKVKFTNEGKRSASYRIEYKVRCMRFWK